jgi:hypothetical protein
MTGLGIVTGPRAALWCPQTWQAQWSHVQRSAARAMPRGACRACSTAADPLPEVAQMVSHDRALRRDQLSSLWAGRFFIAPMTGFANAASPETGFDGSPFVFVRRPFKRNSKVSSCKANVASANLRLFSSSARWSFRWSMAVSRAVTCPDDNLFSRLTKRPPEGGIEPYSGGSCAQPAIALPSRPAIRQRRVLPWGVW